jgi:hypothetical protein
MPAVTMPRWCRMFCANGKMKVLAGPVITETAKASATITSRRRRNGLATAPSTGIGCPDPAAATANRSGSSIQRRSRGSSARGTSARTNTPRNPSVRDARLCTMAMTPAPVPYPAAASATALARSAEAVGSAAVTCASPLLALSKGRLQAKMATNHQ